MGELAALASSLFWAFASVLWTPLARRCAPLPLNFIKTGLAAVILAAVMPLIGANFHAPPRDIALMAASGIIALGLGDTAYFHALRRIGPRRTLLLWTLIPFGTAALAWPVLGEPLTLRLLGTMILTLAGVVLVIFDHADASDLGESLKAGLLFALLAVTAQSVGNVVVKLGGEHLGSVSGAVIRLSAGAAGLGLHLGATGRMAELRAPLRQPHAIRTIIIATVIGTVLGIWTSVYAMLYSRQIAVAATLASLSPVFVLPLSRWMLGERFGARAIGGAALAAAGAAAMAW